MRHLIVLLIVALVGVSACNKNAKNDTIEAINQAEQAQQYLDDEEVLARDLIAELTAIIDVENVDVNELAVEVERWLTENHDVLVSNTLALQERLESKVDPERARYEETFSTFMRPTLDAWKDAQAALKKENPRAHGYVRRALKKVMSTPSKSEPKPASELPAPEDAPTLK